MKRSLAVRLPPELREAATPCAAREHRSPTDIMEASLLARIGDVGNRTVVTRPSVSRTTERPSRGE